MANDTGLLFNFGRKGRGLIMKFIKSDDGKIREVQSEFIGLSCSDNKIWLPAWTPDELRQIADNMEGNGYVASEFDRRIDPKPKRGGDWVLTPEQQDLDEQMNGDDDRPY
jgi:hypothetical protein